MIPVRAEAERNLKNVAVGSKAEVTAEIGCYAMQGNYEAIYHLPRQLG